MRHLTAVHVNRPDGEGWHYANLGRDGGYPLGYCAEHAPHATEDEARRCYQRWLRDHVKLDDRKTSWTRCAIRSCDNAARNAVTVEGAYMLDAVVCDEHFSLPDAVKALDLENDKAGDAWEA